MILTQILYTKGNQTASFVVLILGRKGSKTVCILDNKISQKEADSIKQNIQRLNKFNLANKLNAIKRIAPKAYSDGYRELENKQVKIQKAYSIDNEKYVQVNI